MHRLTLFILLALASSWITNAQDAIVPGPVDASDYPNIELQFRVVQDGIILEEPDSSRLLISENGNLLPSAILCPGSVDEPVSIALGVERSLDSYFPEAKERASAFIQRVRFVDGGDELSLWSFASLPELRLPVTADSARLQQEVAGLNVAQWPFNGTTLYETMYRAVEQINEFGRSRSKALVFVTDGVNNTATFNRTLNQVVTRANTDAIRIYVLGMRNIAAGEAAMRQLCEGTGGFYVHGSDPSAIDSIYEAIAGRYSMQPFCRTTFTSPICADGTNRTIEIRYITDRGDTLTETVSYTAPYRENDLHPLPFWVSPSRMMFEGPDTVVIAAGLTLESSSALRSFTVRMSHPGLLYSGELANMAPPGWQVTAQAIGETTILSVHPVPGEILERGDQLLVRLRMTVPQAADVNVDVSLDQSISECYYAVPVVPERGVRMQIDTLLASRLVPLHLPFRIAALSIAESVQRISLEVRTPRLQARFEMDEPVRLTQNDWIINHIEQTSSGEDEILSISMSRPLTIDRSSADTALELGVLRLTIAANSAYTIPIEITDGVVNRFATGGTPADVDNGLLIVRDSCRNRLVRLGGLLVFSPYPNPVISAATFPLLLYEEGAVSVRVFDALGRCLRESAALLYAPGRHQYVLDTHALDNGSYLVEFTMGNTRAISRMTVSRNTGSVR